MLSFYEEKVQAVEKSQFLSKVNAESTAHQQTIMTVKSSDSTTSPSCATHQISKFAGHKSGAHFNSTNNFQRNNNNFQDKCVFCNGDHSLWHCTAPSSVKRWNLRQKSLCYNCLRKGHSAQECKTGRKCKTCGHLHHTMLHFEKTDQQNQHRNHDGKSHTNTMQNISDQNNRKEDSRHVTIIHRFSIIQC